MTIWEAACRRGLSIPHLCHKPGPGYHPDNNCRACIVEIGGERTLANRAVAKDMVFVPFAYDEAAANLLTNPAIDPYGNAPDFKLSAVSVEKCIEQVAAE